MRASHCGGFSCCGVRGLGAGFSSCGVLAQWLWLVGLVALQHVGSSQTRARTVFPALAGGFLTTAPPGNSHINVLNAQLKDRFSEWIKKQDPTINFAQETHFEYKYIYNSGQDGRVGRF